MATANPGATAELVRGGAPPIEIPLATVSAVAAALLVYVSGSFLVAEIPDAKREVQTLLVLVIAVAASFYLVSRPGRLLNPLTLFAIAKLITEIALRGQWTYVLDSLAAVLAMMVISCAPARSIEAGAKAIVTTAGIFAFMGIAQWAMLQADQRLDQYLLTISDDDHVQGIVEHPIALLGFIDTSRVFTFFGAQLYRMQSFALEPSLNVTYFLLPASLAFLLDARRSIIWGCVLLAFCLLSLSGSVYLTLGFSAICWLSVRVTGVRFTLPYGILMIMGVFLFAVAYFGLEPLLNAFVYLGTYAEFLYKSDSLINRSTGALINVDAALSAPLGSPRVSNIPGPWLINAILAAGWLGAALLFFYLRNMGRELDRFHRASPPWSARRVGSTLLLGALAVVVVFNDYQMSNYAGLVLLAFIYRIVVERANESVRHSSDGKIAPRGVSHATP
jgi:hypothetical protein